MLIAQLNVKRIVCYEQYIIRIGKPKEEEIADEALLGEDVGVKRANMEEEEIEQFSDEEIVVEVQDPYQQWFNKRVFNEDDKKKADDTLYDIHSVSYS